MTVHGIRTFGQWQPRFATILQQANPNLVVFNYVFGYFSIIAFFLPPLRWLLTRNFREELERLSRSYPNARIDLIGHSFGTHLIAWGIYGIPKERRPRVNTVILAGSVLRSNFDWGTLIGDGTIQRVVNDCGTRDQVLIWNQVFVLFTGMAGRLGFQGMTSKNFINRFFVGGHSLYFEAAGKPSDNFMKQYWVPLILSESSIEDIDQRQPPTWFEGVGTTILQNLDAVKLAVYTIVLLIPAFIFGYLYQEANTQRLRADKEAKIAKAETVRAESMRDQTLEALQWVFNKTAILPPGEDMVDEKTKELLQGLFARLKASGFDGRVRIEGYLGLFQGVVRANGEVVLATNDKGIDSRPGDRSITTGSEYSLALGQRQADAMRSIALLQGISDSQIESTSYGREKELVLYPCDPYLKPFLCNDVDAWWAVRCWASFHSAQPTGLNQTKRPKSAIKRCAA